MADSTRREFEVPLALQGQRLDQIVALLCPEFSRSQLQKLIKQGQVLVAGEVLPAKARLQGGEQLVVMIELSAQTHASGEDMALDIVYEDEALLVLNKPAGLVVHPAAGNWNGTLVNGLLGYLPALEKLPRAGIVHRLDKNTTGLMVVAKTLQAHNHLVTELQRRTVKREYRALVKGQLVAGGSIDLPVGRHPQDRKRMCVREGGKPSVTHYRVAEKFTQHTLLAVHLETGRTHQIRVHLSHQKLPIVGDPTYGGRTVQAKGLAEPTRAALQAFPRQALHAAVLSFPHPDSDEWLTLEASLPADYEALLAVLRSDANAE